MDKNESLRGVDFEEFTRKCSAGILHVIQCQQVKGAISFSDKSTLKSQFWDELVVGIAGRVRMHRFYTEKGMTVRDFNKYAKLLYEVASGKKNPTRAEPQATIKVQKHPMDGFKMRLVGYAKQYRQCYDAIMNKCKGIILAGYHGLGKTTMAEDIAGFFKARFTVVQMSETVMDVDLVGYHDPNTGNWLKGRVYEAVEESLKHPDEKHVLLFDEFTRGRESALDIIFPLIASKTLIINNPKAPDKMLKAGDNLIVMATGNVDDKHLRELGYAEFDRWEGVHFDFLVDEELVIKIVKDFCEQEKVKFVKSVFDKVFKMYKLSIEYFKEKRILAMSMRTLQSTVRLACMKIGYGMETSEAISEALEQDYLYASQAIVNPSFMASYKNMLREVGI